MPAVVVGEGRVPRRASARAGGGAHARRAAGRASGRAADRSREGRPRLPADRHARRARAGAAGGHDARGPHRGGGDRQRRSGALLGPARRRRRRSSRGRCATTWRSSRPRSSWRAGVRWSTDGEPARADPARARSRARVAGDDDADPPLRGAGGRDVRAGEGRRLPAPVDRRGGDDRGQRAGAARGRLPDLDLPLARPRARARHAAGERDGRAVRARRRLLARARRLDAHVRPGAPLHGRLRDRRRQPADRRGHRAGQRLPGHGRGHAVHVRRRRLQPGHVRRDAQPRRAVEAAGGVHGHQQPVRHGHVAAAPLGGHGPAAQGREPRRAGHALRRHGRAGHPRGRHRGGAARARRPPAGARRGGHVPLPRPLDGRPRAVPHQGGGRALARARPAAGVRRAAGARGRDRGGRAPSGSTREAIARVDAAVAFAEASPFPAPESLYDDVYVLDAGGARLVLGADHDAPADGGSQAAPARRSARRPTTRSPSS